jgi:hypothetical protein
VVILELIRAKDPLGLHLLDIEPSYALHSVLVIHNNRVNRIASASDISFKFLTYQLDGRVLAYCGFDG